MTPFLCELKSSLTTRIFGRHIYHLGRIDSTNNLALQKAAEGAAEGTLVLADAQTGGRGQGDHTWYSPRGGIYLSIILRPEVAPIDINSWNLMAGLAVRQTISRYTNGEISLKFPNDVLIDGRKVAGILTEMRGDFKRINYLVMGIGINLNFEKQQIPEDLRPMVASLQLNRAGESVRIEIICKLLQNLESLYLSFLGRGGRAFSY